MRDGKPKDIYVTLGEMPEESTQPAITFVNVPELGIDVQEVQSSQKGLFGSRFPKGVQVVKVLRGSEAEKQGIEVGDYIYKINKTEINSLADFQKAVKKYNNDNLVTFYIRNDKGSHLVNIRFRQ